MRTNVGVELENDGNEASGVEANACMQERF